MAGYENEISNMMSKVTTLVQPRFFGIPGVNAWFDTILTFSAPTAERVRRDDGASNVLFQRSMFAYRSTRSRIHGRVLELGTGTGYGLDQLASHCDFLITLDKRKAYDQDLPKNAVFLKMTVPPLLSIPDASMDAVVSHQMIEHIEDDMHFLFEIRRVLRPGGICVLTTPNAKRSLSRNPFHVREYTVSDFHKLLSVYFDIQEANGVFGSPRVEQYLTRKAASVARVRQWDVFGLEHRAPAWMLQLPYSLLDHLNKVAVHRMDNASTGFTDQGDFELRPADDNCLDLYFVLRKPGRALVP